MKEKPVRKFALRMTRGFFTQDMVTLRGQPFTPGEEVTLICPATKQEFSTLIKADVLRFQARSEFSQMFQELNAKIDDKLWFTEFKRKGRRVFIVHVEPMPEGYWDQIDRLRSSPKDGAAASAKNLSQIKKSLKP